MFENGHEGRNNSFNIIDFSNQLQELVYENYELKQEVIRLKEIEQKFNNYVNRTCNATTGVTNAWVQAVLNGDLKIITK